MPALQGLFLVKIRAFDEENKSESQLRIIRNEVLSIGNE